MKAVLGPPTSLFLMYISSPAHTLSASDGAITFVIVEEWQSVIVIVIVTQLFHRAASAADVGLMATAKNSLVMVKLESFQW